MAGSIKSDQRGGCICGGKFRQVTQFKYQVPTCDQCGEYPKKLRITRYLPTLDGSKGKKIEIRYNHSNERLTEIFDAIAVMKLIDKEILEGIFDPRKYGSRTVADQLRFRYFVENKYLSRQEIRLKIGELTYSSLSSKKNSIKNYLIPFFGEIDIRSINASYIDDFYHSFTDKFPSRRSALQELKVIMRFAVVKEMRNTVPVFPTIEESNQRDPENFPSNKMQVEIIKNIDNELYRTMIEIMAIYAIRPCELRAFKWIDFDFKEQMIIIQRHFSNYTYLIEGRKSQKKGEKKAKHFLPMLPRFIELMMKFPRPLNRDEFVFKGKHNDTVSHIALTRAWKKACKKTGVEPMELYEGTKHARLSYLKSIGYSDDNLIMLSGHTNLSTMKKYAKLKNSEELEIVKAMLSKNY